MTNTLEILSQTISHNRPTSHNKTRSCQVCILFFLLCISMLNTSVLYHFGIRIQCCSWLMRSNIAILVSAWVPTCTLVNTLCANHTRKKLYSIPTLMVDLNVQVFDWLPQPTESLHCSSYNGLRNLLWYSYCIFVMYSLLNVTMTRIFQ